MSNDLTPGQDYAVKFLTSKGFKLISSPVQLKRGNLVFDDPLGNKWGIFKNGGYIRKQTPKADRWGVVFRQSGAGASQMDDDQYMDLAEMISVKYNADSRKEQKGKETLGKFHKKVYMYDVRKYRDGLRVKFGTVFVPFTEIRRALNTLVKEKFNDSLSISQSHNYSARYDSDAYYENILEITGMRERDERVKGNNPIYMRILYYNNSSDIGFTDAFKQYGDFIHNKQTWNKKERFE